MTIANAHYNQTNTDRASISTRELLIATAAALMVVFAGAILVTSFTSSAEAVAAQKTDRAALAGNDICAGQAWGAWDEACLAAIAKKSSVTTGSRRVISFETVEIRDAATNTSTLVRQPVGS